MTRLVLTTLLAVLLASPAVLAGDKLRIRTYQSIYTDIDVREAEGATLPVVKLVEQKLKYPIDYGLVAEPDGGLMVLGEQLDAGKIHLASVWGIEYGWLRVRFRNLAPIAMAYQRNGVAGWPVRVMVNDTYDGTTLMGLVKARGGDEKLKVAISRGAPL